MAREKNKQQLLNKHVSQPSPTHDISETWSAAWVLTRRKRKRQETEKKRYAGLQLTRVYACTHVSKNFHILLHSFSRSCFGSQNLFIIIIIIIIIINIFFFSKYTRHVNI